MQGAEEKKISSIKAILTVTLAVVVLIIVGALVSVISTEKKLDLYNIDQVDSRLSTEEIRDLEDFIWQRLRDSQGFDNETGIVALIRPSSYIRAEEDGIKSYEFLVDIDEYKTTYEVSFALVGDEGFYESPSISCPAIELMKYPETDCDGGGR